MKLFSLLRRHSALAALLASAAAAVAAPYLLPADPDTAVFRSGTLGALLLFAAAVPARRALERHSPRRLAFGMAFALVFAVCLSLGSELAAYGGFLPGMGSLTRRVAVPLLVTPLLGLLASYAFVQAREDAPMRGPCKGVFIGSFVLYALCYGAVLLALFPGVVGYDFAHEIAQFTSGAFEAAHPVFHTLLLGFLYRAGEAVFGSMTAGAALYSAVQLLLMAAAYAYATAFAARRVYSRIAVCALAAYFALLPFHGVLAVSTAKDPLFSALCLLLCLRLWRFAETPEDAPAPREMLAFALCALGIALLRHNGLFALIPACLALPALLSRPRRRAGALLGVGTLLLCLIAPRALEAALGAQKTPAAELMSLPCQQVLRAAAGDDLPDDLRAEADEWFFGHAALYRPHCADTAKANFDFERYAENPGAFWGLYLHCAKAAPGAFVEALMQLTAGLWHPGDTSHAHALSAEEYDYVYLNTVYPFAPDAYDIHPRSLLPGLQRLIYGSTHHARHERYAFLAQLFCPAVYSFALLLATLLLFYRRRRRLALCLLPVWGVLFSLLFSAGVFVRYAYPIMVCAPVLLLLAVGDAHAHLRSSKA